MRKKIETISRFKKVWIYTNEGLAMRMRTRLETMTHRMWAVIYLDQFYVLPHRVAVKYFRNDFVF